MIPFAKENGVELEPFDFKVPGVTSITYFIINRTYLIMHSCDHHKYGMSPNGIAVLLYKTSELR